MSYARKVNDSDVYVYNDITHGFTCMSCNIAQMYENLRFPNRKDLLLHMVMHVVAGDRVPEYVFARLVNEIDEGLDHVS